MAKGARLLGVDLVRGFAAYGVVVIHTLGNQPRSPSGARFVALFLGFAVPYFLAVSLYLTAGRLLSKGPHGFLRSRIERMIVPYLVWTSLFVAFRVLLYVSSGRSAELPALVGSPLPLILLGKAAAPLYFVPLLFVGEVTAVGLCRALGGRLGSSSAIVPFALLGIVLSWFDTSRRDPLWNDRSLSDLDRVGLTLASDWLWCLPFIAFAFLFQLPEVRRRTGSIPLYALPALAASLMALDWIGAAYGSAAFLPFATRELILAFGCLAGAVAVSSVIRPARWIDSLSACTFGIYLVHPLVIEANELMLRRAHLLGGEKGTAPWIAALAAVSFAMSWVVVSWTMRVRVLARFLYGVRPRPA